MKKERKNKKRVRYYVPLTILTLWVALIMALGLFTGCEGGENECGIPNGDYIGSGTVDYPLRGSENHDIELYGYNYDWYWRIRGTQALYYASGWDVYRCKIIERSGTIYFVGKKNIKNSNETVQFEVQYNENTKVLTVIKVES